MRSSLLSDLRHKSNCYYGYADWRTLVRVLLSDGGSANVAYRCVQVLRRLRLSPLALVVSILNKWLNGCVIGQGAIFGDGFVLMHPAGVVINGEVRGGERVVIESGVVLGAARNGQPVQAPRLGDDVFIGSGAKVLGGIRVGSNVRIGANAVVLKDVPDGVTVVGIPAQIVTRRAA
jgi:serine O-acetyltransferase